MNNNPSDNRFDNNNNNENIDKSSFERRRRAAEIIQNEEAEREKRRREQIRRRKAERIRQAQIARLKGYCLLGLTALGILFIIIGVITAIVKAVISGNDDKTDKKDKYTISKEETELLNAFSGYQSPIYFGKENDFLKNTNSILESVSLDGTSVGIPAVSNNISEFGALSERYMYMKDSENYNTFKQAVKNAPIFSNGYVWSQTDSMKSSITGSYLYDTNASYILAIANICLSEGNTSFLSETDTDTQPTKDSSQGLTVSKKLEMAINYLFDNNTIDGGIKYDAQYTSLCYIHTMANNGSSTGSPSNRWYNYKFGYLDAYCNITFNKAMRALVKLYTLQGLNDEASKYKAVADQNAAAFSEKFWSSENNRFVGCFDSDGNSYDYGFVFINLEAIEAGMAKPDQASKIFSWLDGESHHSGDTSKGTDIYTYGFAPRNTTLSADDKLWDTLGGSVILSGNGGFGKHYLNGGASLSTAYYDICARYGNGLYDSTSEKLNALIKEYNKNGFAETTDTTELDISGNPLSGLAPVAILKTVFGINSDGLHLTVNPNLSIIPYSGETKLTIEDLGGKYGIKGINFGGSTYGFLYTDGKLYATCDRVSAVRLNLGGFDKNSRYNLIKVTNGSVVGEPMPLDSDENGMISVTTDFGASTYIKVEKTK